MKNCFYSYKLLLLVLFVFPIKSMREDPHQPPYIPKPIWGKMETKPDQEWWRKSPNEVIDRINFFENITGIDEIKFRNLYKWNLENPFNVTKTSSGSQEVWAGNSRRKAIFEGTFEELSIKDLDAVIKTKQPLSRNPYFSIVVKDPWVPWETDIRYLQSSQRDAVFQIASTEYALEGGMYIEKVRLTQMLPHAVQGEEASISAAGGTIWRKYIHGAPQSLLRNYRGNYKDIMIGLHQNVLVTSGYGRSERSEPYGQQQKLPVLTNPQKITQVFTFALNTSEEENQKKAQDLLFAAYEGTLKAAIYCGKPRIFLTLVGGGAFRNSPTLIAEAINNQECKRLIEKYGLQVTLIFHPDRPGRGRNTTTDSNFLNSIVQNYRGLMGFENANLAILNEYIINYLNEFYTTDDKNENATHQYAQEINDLLMKKARPQTAQQKDSPKKTNEPSSSQQPQKNLWSFFFRGNKKFPAARFYLFRYDFDKRHWTFTEEQLSTASDKNIKIIEKNDDKKPQERGYAWVSEENIKQHLQTGDDLYSRGEQYINLDESLALFLNKYLFKN